MTDTQSTLPSDAAAVAEDVFVLPASFTQQRLWFLDQSSNGGPAYNVFAAFCLTGPLDRSALDASLRIVVDRHESLRTTFTEIDGELKQVVTPNLTIPIEQVDGVALKLTDAAALDKHLSAEAARAFDLQSGPLVRVQLIALGPGEAVLFINTHHTIVDGWSMGLLLNELSEAYAATLAHREPVLPDLPIQYGDYAIWQQSSSQAATESEGLEFWKRHLAGDLGVLELPRDRPRPATANFRGATFPFHIDAELTRAINDFSRAESASLFMTLLAALSVVLRRYTGQDDLLVGSPIANRLRAELEHAIGFFANTVVLRCDVSGAPTFRQLLARVRRMALEVYAHQDVPFEQVVRVVKPSRRSPSVNPLFQVMFGAQKVPDALLTLTGLHVEPIFVDNGTSKFDLLVSLLENSQGIDGLFEFNTDLFDRAAMAQLLEHYQIIIAQAIAQPDVPVTQLPMLTAAERQRLVRDLNDTRVDWRDDDAPGPCVHELIAAQAARTPDAIAVVGGRERLTYRELDQQASQLASQLVARGIGAGSLVALSVERTPRMMVALLAVLKAGGAYLPLDPEHPAARRDFILRDANVALLLADGPLAVDGTPTLRLDLPSGRTAAASAPGARDVSPRPSGRGSDAAYVIYTSGSTGQPKGVVVPHRAVVNYLRAMKAEPGLKPNDIVLALTTLTFDIAVLELLFPLSVGAQVVIAPSTDVTDGFAIADLIERHGVTFVQATPASWRLLLEAGWKGKPDLTIIAGGEPLSRDLADALLARGAALWNFYGPTETTVYSTIWHVQRTGPIVIGKPIANTQCYILDADQQLVPPGVVGELYIGGTGVALGYHGRPDLTEQRFVADPFSETPGARMYRTGDLARYRASGDIECLGRTDHQIKLRGFRIELGEIEAVLTAHPDVAGAAVIVREDQPGDPRLVAYLVPGNQEKHLNLDTLRVHAKDRLPSYMVPSAFVSIDALPRTSSGKLDRRALPAPAAGMTIADAGDRVPPKTETELALAAIWRELLGVEVTSVNDDFFDLGGHSLLAMRLVSKIEAKFERHLPAGALFEHGTIAALSRLVAPATPDAAPRRGEALVLFRGTGGERPPLFLLHAVGGEVLSYSALAAVVGIDRPVYGLQADGWTEEEIKTLSIEGMAARYIEEIRAVWPNGPYCLGGFCAGAMIALEMAQQLRRSGAEVALLTIFDHQPLAPAPGQSAFAQGWRFLRNIPLWVADDLSRISPAEFWGRLRSRVRALLAGKEGSRVADVRDQLGMWRFPTYLVPLIEGLFRAVLSYEPGSYGGRVALFRSRCAPLLGPWPCEHDYGWSRITNHPVSVEVLRGSHSTLLLAPFVSNLGARVRAALLGVEAAAQLDADARQDAGVMRSRP